MDGYRSTLIEKTGYKTEVSESSEFGKLELKV